MHPQRCIAVKRGFSAKLRYGANAGLPRPVLWL